MNVQDNKPKAHRGFACLRPEQVRAIARKGGIAAHEKGTAHVWNQEEAEAAGRLGGAANQTRRRLEREGEQ